MVNSIQNRIDGIHPSGTGTIPPGRNLPGPFPFMRPVGQIAHLFIIVETEDGMAIIDQHAAHERVVYEHLRQKHGGATDAAHVESQQLIEPLILELSPGERGMVERHREFLEFLGFGIEEFGGTTYVVRTVPVVLGTHVDSSMVYDIIDGLAVEGEATALEEQRDALLKLLACHSAIRGGEELTMPRIERLLGELLELEKPFTCPHGRPTILRFSMAELEKRFKRTGF